VSSRHATRLRRWSAACEGRHRDAAKRCAARRRFAGIDPVTKRRRHLREVVQPGPKLDDRPRPSARGWSPRLPSAAIHGRTSPSISCCSATSTSSTNTLTLYRGYVESHISPLLGSTRVGALGAEMLDSSYAGSAVMTGAPGDRLGAFVAVSRCRWQARLRRKSTGIAPLVSECTAEVFQFFPSGGEYLALIDWRLLEISQPCVQ
jgi:hypothetical protein